MLTEHPETRRASTENEGFDVGYQASGLGRLTLDTHSVIPSLATQDGCDRFVVSNFLIYIIKEYCLN
jgi:hypothetical protein